MKDEMPGIFLSQYFLSLLAYPQANMVYYVKDAISARTRGNNFMTIDHLKLQYTTHRMPVFTNQVDVWCFMAKGYRREQGGKSSIISTKN